MSTLAALGGPRAVTARRPRWPVWDDAERRAAADVLESGRWWMYAAGEAELGSGAEGRAVSQVEQFEREFAAMHGVKHALAVTSGTTALEICMRAVGLEPGDEVITTPYTFIATSSCVLDRGALPVYVDIDPDTYNIDPGQIEEAITERTRAILPVHFAGELADMESIGEIASRHRLTVIEDAAQAPGVCLEGDRFAASFGEAGIFSFQASKTLNAGEGGAILSNSDAFADTAWGLRHCGRTRGSLWYEHHMIGTNARMTEFCGGLLRTQLARLPEQNARRMSRVAHFFERIENVEGLTAVRLHPKATRRSHYLVILRYDPAEWGGLSRKRFLEALNAEGVPAIAGYTFLSFENPLFQNVDFSSPRSVYMLGRNQPIDYASFAEKCPNAMRAAREEAIWLVHDLFLGGTAFVDQMADAIHKIRANYRALM